MAWKRYFMFSSLALWFRQEIRSSQRHRRLRPAHRRPWKLSLEVLEDRTVLSSWSTVAPMPTARTALAAATGSDGRTYAIGGFDGTNILNTVEAYTPGSNSWSTVTPLPTARTALAAAEGLDGQLYVIGGYNGAYLNTV